MDGAKTACLYMTNKIKCMFCWVEECEEIGKELDWSSLEISLVQILVIVVITNLRIIWTEVENGFKRREFRFEWVDPKRLIKHYKKWELLKIKIYVIHWIERELV